MKSFSFMYWINIILSLFGAFMGNFIQATIFLGIASMYHVGETIVMELRKKNEDY